LKRLVSLNIDAINLVQTGLSRSCRVTVRTSKEYQAESNSNLGRLKALTYLLLANAQLAETEGRTNDAVRAYIDAYRFAHQLGRGGLATDFVLQLSCELIVLRSFSLLIPRLSPSQCAAGLRIIDQTQAEEENLAAVATRNRRWADATFDSSILA